MAVFAGGQQLWRASLDSATSVRAEGSLPAVSIATLADAPFSHTPNPHAFTRLPTHGRRRGRAVRRGGLPCRLSNCLHKARKGVTGAMYFCALTWRFV